MANVNYRDTLVTYLRAETLKDAAKTLGVSAATLSGRIKQMRRAGVNVPRKARNQGITKLEVAQLNSIIKKHIKESDA